MNKATSEVAVALHNLEAAYPPNKRIGLIVDEVTIEFNVTAAATDGGIQQLNLANVPLQGPGGTFGASLQGQQTANANRGNIITVKFKNIATADMTKGAFRASGSSGGSSGGGTNVTLGQNNQLSEPVSKPSQRDTSGPKSTNCGRFNCTLGGNPELKDR
ncbi:hypothetical protein [Pseudorhizobium marinum]|uniref:hypothetical protein n=1 Tax=Pseudorhizobium marinum TaxID=1496690 RepID=UPI0012DDFB21|nr:hypothetical protein [Pseudorhizobium marinum]